MKLIVPWSSLCAVIEPHYPKAGNGRPPIGLERMLRIHFISGQGTHADVHVWVGLVIVQHHHVFVVSQLGTSELPRGTNTTTQLHARLALLPGYPG